MAFTYCTNCGERLDESVDKCPHCGHPKGAERSFYTNIPDNSQPPKDSGNGNSPDGQNNPYGGQNNPYGGQNNPYGGQNNPYGGQNNPYGGQNNPYGGQNNPNGGQNNPYGGQNNPYGGQNNPYGGQNNPYGGQNNPYGGQNNPYGGQNNPYGGQNNPYGGQNNPYGVQPPVYGGQNQPQKPQRSLSAGLLVYSIINIFFGCCCFGMMFGIIGLIYTLGAQKAASDEEEISKKKTALVINIIGTVLTVAFYIAYFIGIYTGAIRLDTYLG